MRVSCILFILIFFNISVRAQFPTKAEEANYKAAPFNNVVFLHVKRNKFPWFLNTLNRSTGFFIDKNTILTAAHNLHSGFWSKVRKVTIIPGKHHDDKPFGSLIINKRKACKKAIRSARKYRFANFFNRRIKSDYAIIKLTDEQVNSLYNGQFNDHFDLRNQDFALNVGDTIVTAGYPAEGVPENMEVMKTQSDTIDSINKRWPTIIYYDLETKKGNSGSPVWKEINGKNIVVGIHTGAGLMTYLDEKALKELQVWLDEK